MDFLNQKMAEETNPKPKRGRPKQASVRARKRDRNNAYSNLGKGDRTDIINYLSRSHKRDVECKFCSSIFTTSCDRRVYCRECGDIPNRTIVMHNMTHDEYIKVKRKVIIGPRKEDYEKWPEFFIREQQELRVLLGYKHLTLLDRELERRKEDANISVTGYEFDF